MLIDPFVVIAQIINFLILVVLLKRFLYQPITQAMEARAQRIERQLEEAAIKDRRRRERKRTISTKTAGVRSTKTSLVRSKLNKK